jgi:HEAT repeat protein
MNVRTDRINTAYLDGESSLRSVRISGSRLRRPICGKAPLFRTASFRFRGDAAVPRSAIGGASAGNKHGAGRKSRAFPQIDGHSPQRRSPSVSLRSIPILLLLLLLQAFAIAQTENSWPQTESRLIQLLSGNSEQKRTALAEIRNLRTEQASRLAVPALHDKDEIVRATAAASVVFLLPPEAAAALLPLLSDKKPFVRREAAYALGIVRDRSATQRLINVLNTDRDREVRSAAAVALGKIGDLSAIDPLVAILRKKPIEDDEFLRRSSARAIGQIFDLNLSGRTSPNTPQNFLPPKYKDVPAATDAAQLPASVNITSIIAVLAQVLRNMKEADDTRREAAYALGAIRQPASADLLRSYLNSPDPYLSEISKEALLKIEDQQ